MPNETIKQILIRRDSMTPEAADQLIADAKAELQDLLAEGDEEAAYNICEEWFGLEPDYIMELMD